MADNLWTCLKCQYTEYVKLGDSVMAVHFAPRISAMRAEPCVECGGEVRLIYRGGPVRITNVWR